MARVSRIKPGDEVLVEGYWARVERIDSNHRLHCFGVNGSWSGVFRGRQVIAVKRDGKRVIA